MPRDLDVYAGLTKVDLQIPASKTSSGRSSSVDVRDFTGRGFAVLTALNTAGTTPTLDAKLETSAASGSGQGDLTGAAFTEVTDATASIQIIPLDFDDPNLNHYLDLAWTIGGTSTPTFTLSGAIFGRKRTF